MNKHNVSKKSTNTKTAIIYCRAARTEDAERQRAAAEGKAKELNAVVEEVFTDILPMQRKPLWRRLVYFYRRHSHFKTADKRVGWRSATHYYKNHRVDYVIAQSADRFSRSFQEFQRIKKDIEDSGAQVAFAGVSQAKVEFAVAWEGCMIAHTVEQTKKPWRLHTRSRNYKRISRKP